MGCGEVMKHYNGWEMDDVIAGEKWRQENFNNGGNVVGLSNITTDGKLTRLRRMKSESEERML